MKAYHFQSSLMKTVLLLGGLFYVLSIGVLLNPKIDTNDAIGYYANTVALIENGSFDVKAPYAYYHSTKLTNNLKFDTTTQHFYSQYPIGVSLMQTPFFYIKKLCSVSSNYSPYENGFTRWINVGSALYILMGLACCFLLLRQLFSLPSATITTTIIAFCSSLYFYAIIQPSLSHGYSFFLVALFAYLLYGRWKEPSKRTFLQFFLLGSIAGGITICRYMDGIIVIPLIVEYLYSSREKKAENRAATALKNLIPYLIAFVGFLLVVSIQLGINWNLHHNLNILPYYDGHFEANSFLSNLWKVPFSSHHGIFYWHPALLLFFPGSIFLLSRGSQNWKMVFSILLILILSVIVSSAWGRFAFGASSFGHRFFVSYYPLFALPIAACIHRLFHHYTGIKHSKMALALLFLFICWNFSLIYQMVTYMIPSDAPVSLLTMAKNTFFEIPLELFRKFSLI